MKGRKKNIKQKDPVSGIVHVQQQAEMPPVEVVVEEREREAAYERELARLSELQQPDDGCNSDGEGSLRKALQSLQSPGACRPQGVATAAAAAAAAALLPAMTDALRAHCDVAFLEQYCQLLKDRTEQEAQAATEKLMSDIEDALSSAQTTGGTVLASWLAAACVWNSPRVPRALPALHAVLHHLTETQVGEVCGALQAALGPRELLTASDATRGCGPLADLLLGAALDRLTGPRGESRLSGPPTAEEVHDALVACWGNLDAFSRLTGVALAGRVMAGAPPGVARALLDALVPLTPQNSHDPAYLQVSVAVKTLQNLVEDM